jgi:hypothetical protein
VAETNQLSLEIEKTLPNKVDQEALSLYREVKNNPDLQTRLQTLSDNGKIPPEFQKAVTAVLDPANAQKYSHADTLLQDYYKGRSVEGQAGGYIKGDIQNYITHLGVTGENGEPLTNVTSGSPMSRRTPYGQGRQLDQNGEKNTFVSLFEKGMKPTTLNSADILRIYGSRDAVANASTNFMKTAKESGLGKWFTPDEVPSDWTRLDPYGRHFENTMAVAGKDGPIKVTQIFAVPKTIADSMKPIIEPDWLKKVGGIGKWRAAQSWAKYVNLSLSFFHAKALTISGYNSEPMAVAKSFITDMSSPDFKSAELDLIKDGGTSPILGGEYNAYRNLQPKSKNILISNPITNAFNALAKKTSGITFDTLARKYKVLDYSMKKAKWLADNPNATTEEISQAGQKIASYVNDVYGGLNWEKMGISKSTLTGLRTLLLAPDWTFSNLVGIAQGVKGSVPRGNMAAFLAISFATGIVLTELTNKLLNGKFSADPFNVTLGYRSDGTEVKANMFFAGGTKDLVSLFTKGPIEFASGKAAPFVSTMAQEATNKDYFGNPIRNPGKGLLGNTLSTGQHLLGGLPIPFSLSSPLQLFTGAKNAGAKPLASEMALSATGMGQISTKRPARDAYTQAYNDAIGQGKSDMEAQLAGINAEKSVKSIQTTGQLYGQSGKDINTAANQQVENVKTQNQLKTDLKNNTSTQSTDLLTTLKGLIGINSAPTEKPVVSTQNINGSNIDGYTLSGKFYYNDPDTGDLKTTSLTTLAKTQISDKNALQNATYSLKAQELLRAKDYNGWLDATQKQIQALTDYQKTLDPTADQTKIITLQNTIEDLQTTYDKYKSYGGFSKPKKPPKITIAKTPTMKFTASKIAKPRMAKIVMPKLPKLPKMKIAKAKSFKMKNIKLAKAKTLKITGLPSRHIG